MPTPNFYVLGTEGETLTTTGSASWTTTANTFRSGISRGAWSCPAVANGGFGSVRNRKAFSASTFYATFRVCQTNTNASGIGTPTGSWNFLDANGIIRLRMVTTSYNSGVFTGIIQKVNAAGTATQLGSSFNFAVPLFGAGIDPLKVDIFINDAVSGQFSVYLGGATAPTFNFTGDTTTDSVTSLAGMDVGSLSNGGGVSVCYSEYAISDSPTFSGIPATIPVGSSNGNTHNWDTGSPTASNINKQTVNDLTYDGSSVAGQIDQYTIGSGPSGLWSASVVRMAGRVACGVTGPSKIDFGWRLSGADYWSTDLTCQSYYDLVTYDWFTSPATGIGWAASEFTAVGNNIGMQSVT